jgi:hypothetical protein
MIIHTQKIISLLFNKFISQIEKLGPINLIGPNGIGKTYYIKEFIRNIQCSRYIPFSDISLNYSKECDCCVCRKIIEDKAMDILTLNSDLNNIENIKETRNKIEDFIYSNPKEFKFKFLIIRNLQYFSEQSSNVFLRILEEPPGYLKIFTTCDDRHNVLNTLLSRLKSFQCDPLNKEDIKSILNSNNKLEIYLRSLTKYDFKTLDQILVYIAFSFEDKFKKFFLEGIDTYSLDKEMNYFMQNIEDNLEYKKEYILNFFIEFYIQRVREFFTFKKEDPKIIFFKDKFENNFIPIFSDSFFKYLNKSNPFINYNTQMFIFLNLMNIFKKTLGG